MRVRGIVSYDGSRYYGFQIQSEQNVKTIQGELNRVLSKILDCEICIQGAGRTDRGVHALNQGFHFDVDKDVDLNKLLYGVNSLLDEDIVVKSLEKADESFHARFSVKKKHYRYVISLKKNPFEVNYALTYTKPLDINRIREGMKLFLGKHNFVNFCANNEEDGDYEREIHDFTLKEENDHLVFDIYGNGFRRYMVRMIIGTLIALGSSQINEDYIKERFVLPLGNNTQYNAAPQGLYLAEVIYD